MIDSHIHLDSIFYHRDRKRIIQQCIDEGITIMINVGTNYNSSVKSVNLAKDYKEIYASVGIHPKVINELDDNSLNDIKILAGNSKVVAIGEIGLDYRSLDCNKDLQREGFKKQVMLAKALDLPVIVHSKNAHEDIIEILNDISPPIRGGVIHGFSGDENLIKKYLDIGFYVSIAGNITYKGDERTLRAIEKVDLGKILVETDSPFISPDPFRNKRNYPGNVKFVIQIIAQVKGLSIEQVVRITSENAYRVFNIL